MTYDINEIEILTTPFKQRTNLRYRINNSSEQSNALKIKRPLNILQPLIK